MLSLFRARIVNSFFYQVTLCDLGITNAILPTLSKFDSCNINTRVQTFKTKPDQKETISKIREDDSETFGLLETPLEARKRNEHSKRSVLYTAKKSDVFGNLSENKIMWYPEINEESKKDNDPSDDSVVVRNISKRYRCPKTYFYEMRRLVKEKRLKEALDLFPDMRRNYVTPVYEQYTFMISACGKVGYTDMAFKLFRQMTDRGDKPSSATLTALFNACAESPFPDKALKIAHNLQEKLKSKNWSLNQITYHSMIKAFGKCGDIKMAFQIVDEMAKEKIKIDVVTYSFLLMSCISNKEAGFTHAVEVWRKMKAKKCTPNLYTCNLLLRAVRDCDAGPEEISNLLLQHWSSYSSRPYGFKTKKKFEPEEKILFLKNAPSDTDPVNITNIMDSNMKEYILSNSTNKMFTSSNNKDEVLLVNNAKEIETVNFQHSTTSLLDTRPLIGPEIMELGDISSCTDRLALLGGMDGFLKFMAKANVKPDIRTFSLLLGNLPSNTESEENLLYQLEAHKVQPDIDFFNVLIRKRNFRHDSKAAHEVLFLINKYSLLPDIITFGVLALGCRSHTQALTLINDMKKFDIYPSIAIVDSLLRNAGNVMDFKYLQTILELLKQQEIQPDEYFLKRLEKLLDTTRTNIINMEHGKKVASIYYQDNFKQNFKEFYSLCDEWLKSINVDKEQHPWDQYATDIILRTKDELTH